MSLDRSLKSANALIRHRNVLTRDERLLRLKEAEKWDEKKSVFGLPKVANRKLIVGGKGAKEEVAEGAAGQPPNRCDSELKASDQLNGAGVAVVGKIRTVEDGVPGDQVVVGVAALVELHIVNVARHKLRMVERIVSVASDAPHACPCFIHERRRESGCEIHRQCLWMPEKSSAKPAGPGFIVRISRRVFVRVTHTNFVARIEIVIYFRIDLLSAGAG